MVPLHVCGIQYKGHQAFWGRTCHHGSGRDRPMMTLLIPAAAERVPIASGGTAGRSPRSDKLANPRAQLTVVHTREQQEGGHGALRNTEAGLDRATIRPCLELAGLSTLQHDRLVCGALPSAAIRSSCAPRLGGSDSRRPLAHLRAQANCAHLSRRTDHRHEPHPLSLIRHRDQFLPVSAPFGVASHAEGQPI